MSEGTLIKGEGIFEKSVRTSLAQEGQNEKVFSDRVMGLLLDPPKRCCSFERFITVPPGQP